MKRELIESLKMFSNVFGSDPHGKILTGHKGVESQGCESKKNHGFKRNKRKAMKK